MGWIVLKGSLDFSGVFSRDFRDFFRDFGMLNGERGWLGYFLRKKKPGEGFRDGMINGGKGSVGFLWIL